jgi:hypothetical protein
VQTTHVAAISTTPDRVTGEACNLSIATAAEDTSRDGFGREYTGYLMSDDVVYLADLPSAPTAADHPAELAVAAAEGILKAYGWYRMSDWTESLDGVLYAELAPADGLRTVTLMSVPAAGSFALDGTDLADHDTPPIVGLMTHPAVTAFIRDSGYRAGGHGAIRIHVLTGPHHITGYPTLTITLPTVPLTGRKLEDLGLTESEWMRIDWGVGQWVFTDFDNQVFSAPRPGLWLLDVPEDTSIGVPQASALVTVPTGGYLVVEYGPGHAQWVETTKHTRAEAFAAFAQRGGFPCPDCEMPLPTAPDTTTCPRCTARTAAGR